MDLISNFHAVEKALKEIIRVLHSYTLQWLTFYPIMKKNSYFSNIAFAYK